MAIFNSYVSLPEGINCCFSGNPNHHSMTMSRSWKMYSNAACKVWLPEPVAMDGMAMEALKYAAPRHQRWNLLTWMIYKMWQRFSDMDSPSDFPVKKVRDHFCAFRARSCLAGLALAIYGRLNVNESMHSFFFKPVQTPRSTYTCTYYHIIYVYIIHVSIYLYIYIIMYLQNYWHISYHINLSICKYGPDPWAPWPQRSDSPPDPWPGPEKTWLWAWFYPLVI